MGEFGFITADDVYHVTVYATDENGNYKIISMKNIKLMKMPPPTTTTQAPTTSSTTPVPFKIITTAKPSASAGKPACASCKLPDVSGTSTQSSTDDSTTELDSSAAPPPFKVVSKGDTTDVPSTEVDVLPQKIVKLENNTTKAGSESIKNKNLYSFNQHNKMLSHLLATTPGPNENAGETLPELANRINSNSDTGDSSTKGPQTSQQLVQNFNGPQFFNKENANSIGTYNKAENMLNGLLYKFNVSFYHTNFCGKHN